MKHPGCHVGQLSIYVLNLLVFFTEKVLTKKKGSPKFCRMKGVLILPCFKEKQAMMLLECFFVFFFQWLDGILFLFSTNVELLGTEFGQTSWMSPGRIAGAVSSAFLLLHFATKKNYNFIDWHLFWDLKSGKILLRKYPDIERKIKFLFLVGLLGHCSVANR